MVASIMGTPWMAHLGFALMVGGWLLTRNTQTALRPFIVVGLCLAIWIAISRLAALVDGGQNIAGVPSHWYAWLAFPLGFIALSDYDWRRRAFVTLVFVVSMSAVLATIQVAIGLDKGRFLGINELAQPVRVRAAAGFSHHTISFGFASLLAAAMIFGDGLRERETRGLSRIGRSASVICLLGCASRGALLAILPMVLTLFMKKGGNAVRTALILASCAGIALLLVASFGLRQPERLSQIWTGHDSSHQEFSRWVLWRAAFSIANDSPFVGAGGDGPYRSLFPRTHAAIVGLPKAQEKSYHPHNAFLAWAAYYGWPSLALHLLLITTVLVIAHRQGPWSFRATGAIVLGYGISGQFEPFSLQSQPGFALWIALAFAAHADPTPQPAAPTSAPIEV